MRLTLRTLLAYMDGILDPPDQEDLAQRIAASDVATDLLHRTQETSRRLRLPPPPLEATGPFSDPNAVAEYLDNAMAPDTVTEFERRCLDLDTFPDADSHLAEVASCHHVLTMVLAQRADIDPGTKQRLYDLARESGARTAAAMPQTPPEPAAPAAAPTLRPEAHVSQVPDYLKASEKSMLTRLLPAIAALLLLGVTALFALGPGGWMTADNDEPTAPPQGEPAEQPAPPPQTDPTAPDAVTPEDADQEQTPPSADPELGVDPLGPMDDEQEGANPDQPDRYEPTPPPAIPEGPNPQDITDDPSAGVADDPERVRSVDPTPPIPEPRDADRPTDPAAPPIGDPTEDSQPPEDEAEGTDLQQDSQPDTPPEEPIAPEPPDRVGLVFSPSEVLLRFSAEEMVWKRLGLRAEVRPGDHLLSLPTYRPTIALDNAVSLDMFDGTAVDVGLADAMTPSVVVVYGKVVLTNTSNEPREIALRVGDYEGPLTLGPGGAAIAIEAQREFRPGTDPREIAAPLDAAFYAPLGEVRWEGEDFTQNAESRARWRLSSLGLSEPEPYEEDPDWMLGRTLTRVEREASPRLESQLQVGEPIWSQLSAIAQSPRKDDRALANLFAVHIGQFGTTIQALRDEEQQLSWADEIEALRAAMSARPAMAAAVYEELGRQHRKELADDLWEMLRGYNLEQVGQTPDQWRLGAMRKLIDWLGSDQLDYRVLANYNLEQITGRRSVFNPVGTSGTREKSINRQRARLEDGDLRPTALLP